MSAASYVECALRLDGQLVGGQDARLDAAIAHLGIALVPVSEQQARLARRAFEMFGNLMDNAAKWAARRVEVSVWREGRGLHVRVDDDGPGFGDRHAILQLHVRGDEKVPGHGVGLAVVNELVASHDGELDLGRSELGGARVDIVLRAA